MNSRDLKRRISSVRDTVKITRAMQMIATSKLYKARQKSAASYEYLKMLEHILRSVNERVINEHLYCKGNGSDKVAIIVIAGDKGLCGDFNHRMLALADQVIAERNVSRIYAVGQEAREHCLRRHLPVSNFYAHIASEPHTFDAIAVAEDMLKRYEAGEYGEIYLAYTATPTYTTTAPKVKKLLPIEVRPDEGADEIYEPATEVAAADVLSQYVMAQIYNALADSNLAINYKRMIAMQESTKNGEEIITAVTLDYNHQRQESITSELVTSSASGLLGKKSL
ncbi:MAG: ATP synthase F1 subunit gamma [Christensenellaceae bacterium]